MKKLAEIKELCQQSLDEYKSLEANRESVFDDYSIEQGRAELAEEVLEILNGVKE